MVNFFSGPKKDPDTSFVGSGAAAAAASKKAANGSAAAAASSGGAAASASAGASASASASGGVTMHAGTGAAASGVRQIQANSKVDAQLDMLSNIVGTLGQQVTGAPTLLSAPPIGLLPVLQLF